MSFDLKLKWLRPEGLVMIDCFRGAWRRGAVLSEPGRSGAGPRAYRRGSRHRGARRIRVATVHAEGTKVPSLTRNENTSKHATGRKRYRPEPTVAHRWAGLCPLREQGRVRCSRSHFYAATCVWVTVLSFFVKGYDSQLVAYRRVST